MVRYLWFKFSVKHLDTHISAFSHHWHIIQDINQNKNQQTRNISSMKVIALY